MNMKYLTKLWLSAIAVSLLASCADDSKLLFEKDKPANVAELEYLRDYDVLKSYIDRNTNPNFKLGAGVSVSDFTKQGVDHSLIVSNFDEVTAGWEMKHGAVVQDGGSLSFASVSDFISKSKASNVTIYGHTLTWHANQNAEYLNSTIAPTVIPGTGGPSWEVISSADFETDDESNFTSNAEAVRSFTADGTGADGTGRALQVTNAAVRANDWNSQFFITFSPATQVGEKYILSMDVRADAAATFSTQAHVVPYSYKHWNFFDQVSANTTWAPFVKEITISAETSGTTAIAFNLGNTATSYYFDNIKVSKFNESGGGPTLEPSIIPNSDFENGDGGWAGWGNGSTRGLSAAGGGFGDAGYAYSFTNPSAVNFWEAQVAYDLSPMLQMGSTYVLNFKVKASIAGNIRAEIQSSADYSSDGFGTFAVTTDWEEHTLQTTANKEDRNRFLFSFGDFAGTVYVDDVTLRRIDPDGGGDQIIEKTPAEKKEIIYNELERWIAGMLEVSKEYVKAWDVVNEPMDDGDPYKLKTGVGKELSEDEFYWQDYLGKDYAVDAFKLAAQYGNSNDILFINDYNLEYNLDKCRGLIEYVEYIESQGARVDGIGTQMHISTDSEKEKITQMFELLAETGKLIKISELDIGVEKKTPQAVDEDYKAQAEMYQFVVEKYFEIIPAAQRYGITIWSPRDSPASSSWRAGEPIGLWTEGYNRKRAYAGFAEGLDD
jgi:GH35 family endo-1,4-beta-xylanase